MGTAVKPYSHSDDSKKVQVAKMFDNISARYDFLNRVLSLGIDITWRIKLRKLLKAYQPKTILDIATGTADLAIELSKLNPTRIDGVDISAGMLELGKQKVKNKNLDSLIYLNVADSEALPFPDQTYDAVTVSFGVRNFENLEAGLREMNRVLKPSGVVLILEFSKPTSIFFGSLYKLYFKYILPKLGKFISGDNSAYTYLPDSVEAFPSGTVFVDILKACGFANVKTFPLTFGVSTIYLAQK